MVLYGHVEILTKNRQCLASCVLLWPDVLCWLQFVASLTSNIETLTSSPVNVTIANYTSGSVVATINTYFLDDNEASATTYATVMKSGEVSSVFGSDYGTVTVDPNSVKTTTVTNPSSEFFQLLYQCFATA